MEVKKVKMSVDERISQLMGLGICPRTEEKVLSSSYAVAELSDGIEFIHRPSHIRRITKRKMPPAFKKIFSGEGVKIPEGSSIRTEIHYLVRPISMREREIYSFRMPSIDYFPRYKNLLL